MRCQFDTPLIVMGSHLAIRLNLGSVGSCTRVQIPGVATHITITRFQGAQILHTLLGSTSRSVDSVALTSLRVPTYIEDRGKLHWRIADRDKARQVDGTEGGESSKRQAERPEG